MHPYKINLPEKDIPKAWYNVVADLPFPLSPPMHPGTKKPLKKEDLQQIFPDVLIEQEMSAKRWIAIPDEVIDIYRLWRPTPLRRAYNLEKFLKTRCRIYYKDESSSPIGSHKANTSVPQAYYNKKAGIKRISTETGAGQWGAALSFACNKFELGCRVYMVKVSYHQKIFPRTLMHIWGSDVVASPSELTDCGRAILKEDPHCQGSLGVAISEAVEEAAKNKDTNYALGSVLNHVLLHQTVIGLELKKQLALVGEKPDYLIACVGGGSNFGGFAFPFVKEKLKNDALRIIGVEPTACPTLTKGILGYDFGDTAKLTPLLRMYTLGHKFMPAGIHAGGLRYHGVSPLVSALYEKKLMEAMAYPQLEVFQAAHMFAKAEGIIPAPESSHAIACAIEMAKKEKKAKCIVFNLSGHGLLDLASYEKYLHGELINYAHPQHEIERALKDLPTV
ncbi:MAG TPA: TrpB-like pyridoxal phosphate-dependent enzyme [Candidatus Omnitrophota bacterium]|nr:TrpB-like pyridoxal phosphate-dependent enzyme [Candidatus Omnitrophota bacterium]HPT06808.1 TrpB-like pyridoxal phosphate-dependent enzyme [Candidatus Omnitrophota bacterium]